MATLGEVGELALIERLLPYLAPDGGELVVGVGDDAAAWLPPDGESVVVTTDSLAEGSHFVAPLTGEQPADLGWRLLAVSLSDLAAMGARPGPAFISLALPPAWPVAAVDGLYRGLAACAAAHGVKLAGGNVTAADSAVLTSTCLGSAPAGRLLRRGGARTGWQIAVTGALGAAAARLRAAAAGDTPDRAWEHVVRPTPRVGAGLALAGAGVTVAIDVSDGLFVDAAHLLEGAAAAGAWVDPDLVPVAPGIRERWPHDWLRVAGGGEDYELLFAAPAAVMHPATNALAALGVPAAVVGGFDDGAGLRLRVAGREAPVPAAGHQHFRAE